MKVLMQNKPLNEAVQQSRLHHQLMPLSIRRETRFDYDILAELESRGHQVQIEPKENNGVVQAIQKHPNWLEAVSDARKDGVPDGY